ncbi:GIY-YIG nuclease family protein [Streptomyces nigrescens]|uniref:GIY-YIG nuclease family protein n=1 Tax=Streptomyces nigrescens TaxID=1920 RepID=A0A640TEK1_STRNI|nr:GIY-YIG nuclease family protein [Streptomyces libani]WAT94926.1 GIY-YIG nuclease family protein [Streptomyces libani subsp. libani]GFE20075.1 hypothetical protein Sliba_05280 [Streptomyces libani subsp. libani]GGV85770.1 hypothetical protein GCM10010500_02810 [Streptomyces libani subsp. libani]
MTSSMGERPALHHLYGAKQSEDAPPFLRQLYPQFLRYWQYLGTGARHCPLGDSGYFYVPSEFPDAPFTYELEIRWPRDTCEVSPARTAVYRLRDQTGRLLYVGISDDPLRRWPEHAKDKPWWPEVANFSTEWLASRPEALAAEASAIKLEKPLYNVVHNSPVLTTQ